MIKIKLTVFISSTLLCIGCYLNSTKINDTNDIKDAKNYGIEFNSLLFNGKFEKLYEKYHIPNDVRTVTEISQDINDLIGTYLSTNFDSVTTERIVNGENRLYCRLWLTNNHSNGTLRETLFIEERNSVPYWDSLFVQIVE
jgi:hypothetical protein